MKKRIVVFLLLFVMCGCELVCAGSKSNVIFGTQTYLANKGGTSKRVGPHAIAAINIAYGKKANIGGTSYGNVVKMFGDASKLVMATQDKNHFSCVAGVKDPSAAMNAVLTIRVNGTLYGTYSEFSQPVLISVKSGYNSIIEIDYAVTGYASPQNKVMYLCEAELGQTLN